MPLTLQAALLLAATCAPDVAPGTLLSIGHVESGISRVHVDAGLNPLAIHDNTTGSTVPATTQDDAVARASALLRAGHSVDLGLMQINNANMGWLGLSIADAFDACKSMGAAQKVLKAGYTGGETNAEKQAALVQAISRYNTGDPARGIRNGYVGKVEASARYVIPEIHVEGTADTSAAKASADKPGAIEQPPPRWDLYGTARHLPAAFVRNIPQ